MDVEKAKILLEQLKNREVETIIVEKSDFLSFRAELVKRADFMHFNGEALRGGVTRYVYLDEPRS
ncbi:MAG: hypothetical protein ACRC5C_07300 [Bacilli bacterium]